LNTLLLLYIGSYYISRNKPNFIPDFFRKIGIKKNKDQVYPLLFSEVQSRRIEREAGLKSCTTRFDWGMRRGRLTVDG